jgi:hypothetical protein
MRSTTVHPREDGEVRVGQGGYHGDGGGVLLCVAEVAIGVVLSKERAPRTLHFMPGGPHGEFEACVALREGDLAHAVAASLSDGGEFIVGGVAAVGRTASGAATAFEFGAELFVGERAEVQPFLQ